MKDQITAREKYDPAMRITDQQEADAYFKECVQHQLRINLGLTPDIAEDIERQNLGYWAGYGTLETRARIERLFKAFHPILPSTDNPQPNQAEIMKKGFRWARANRPVPWPRRSEPFE